MAGPTSFSSVVVAVAMGSYLKWMAPVMAPIRGSSVLDRRRDEHEIGVIRVDVTLELARLECREYRRWEPSGAPRTGAPRARRPASWRPASRRPSTGDPANRRPATGAPRTGAAARRAPPARPQTSSKGSRLIRARTGAAVPPGSPTRPASTHLDLRFGGGQTTRAPDARPRTATGGYELRAGTGWIAGGRRSPRSPGRRQPRTRRPPPSRWQERPRPRRPAGAPAARPRAGGRAAAKAMTGHRGAADRTRGTPPRAPARRPAAGSAPRHPPDRPHPRPPALRRGWPTVPRPGPPARPAPAAPPSGRDPSASWTRTSPLARGHRRTDRDQRPLAAPPRLEQVAGRNRTVRAAGAGASAAGPGDRAADRPRGAAKAGRACGSMVDR